MKAESGGTQDKKNRVDKNVRKKDASFVQYEQ
jgi:hypothetical protein